MGIEYKISTLKNKRKWKYSLEVGGDIRKREIGKLQGKLSASLIFLLVALGYCNFCLLQILGKFSSLFFVFFFSFSFNYRKFQTYKNESKNIINFYVHIISVIINSWPTKIHLQPCSTPLFF